MNDNFISYNPLDAYLISFSFDMSDYDSLTNTWNKIINNTLPQPGSKLDNNQLVPTTNLEGVHIDKLSTEHDAVWFFLAQTFATPFSFSALRICNSSMEPSYGLDSDTIISIVVNFTLVDIPTTNDSLLNDKLTSVCLGEWITDVLNNSASGKFLTVLKSLQYAPRTIFKNLRCAGSYSPTEVTNEFINSIFNIVTPTTSPSYSTSPTNNPSNTRRNPIKSNTNNVSEKFSSILNSDINNVVGYDLSDQLVETITNVQGKTVKTSPSTLFDWVFMYAYFFSFVGSIFFSIISIINIDINSILINRNVSFILNLYIGICGAVSFCIWYNIENPVFGITSLNPGVVKTNNSY
jgi:hypothetical protein